MPYKTYYDYLDANIETFFFNLGINDAMCGKGLITAHGDKAYSYKSRFEDTGIHFYHGVALYLLTRVRPYCEKVRETADGWVDTCDWICENKDRFLPYLPSLDFCELVQLNTLDRDECEIVGYKDLVTNPVKFYSYTEAKEWAQEHGYRVDSVKSAISTVCPVIGDSGIETWSRIISG